MSTINLPLTRDSIVAAHNLIKPHIHTTPVLTNTTLSNIASTPQNPEALKGTQWEGQEPAKPKIRLFFKAENFQKIGAFKVRGAFHAVLRLIEERGIEDVREKGVVTHSSGMFKRVAPHGLRYHICHLPQQQHRYPQAATASQYMRQSLLRHHRILTFDS